MEQASATATKPKSDLYCFLCLGYACLPPARWRLLWHCSLFPLSTPSLPPLSLPFPHSLGLIKLRFAARCKRSAYTKSHNKCNNVLHTAIVARSAACTAALTKEGRGPLSPLPLALSACAVKNNIKITTTIKLPKLALRNNRGEGDDRRWRERKVEGQQKRGRK